MTKEIRILSPKKFSQKAEETGSFLKGSWTLTSLLMESVEALKVMKHSHQESERKVRRCHQLLSLETLVTPSVQKMGEKKHASIVADDGPMSSPIDPPSDYEDEQYN
ncbi:hypothetical protein BJV82DRAFT_666313 [Fennellomyces sp. T-0311]|nr:hypothetical protein BJV82DRAFT_666313 [Fennellomyces sp. T-0311]